VHSVVLCLARVVVAIAAQKTANKPSLKDEIERDWRLVLHDDTFHTIQQVVEILGSVSNELC
jgi:hypothetical protein